MAKRQIAIRFGVSGEGGRRAASWKCWAEIGRGKNDVYVACRVLGGVIKTSLHESGDWLVDYDWKKFPSMFEGENKPPSRKVMELKRPQEHAPGITVACRVTVPWHSPTISKLALDPKVVWFPTAPTGNACEFVIILTSKGRLFEAGDWPGRSGMNTTLVGSFSLDSGDRVWVVHHVIDWTDPPALPGMPRFAKGKSVGDVFLEGVRAVAMNMCGDGSVALYDLPVKIRKSGQADAR